MFPGANADREGATYTVVGAPLDASTTFRPGARFGPRLLSHVAESFSDYDQHTDLSFTDLGVHDGGEIHPGDDAEEYLEFLRGTLADYREEGAVPLLVGGEHTVTVAGLRAVEPDVYVCLDAHLDLRERYKGNPLNHATVAHHALEVVDRVVILGARAGSREGWERAETDDRITVVPPAEVGSWEPTFDDQEVYLSVDIDAADPGFAPGTGTPEPFGLDPRTMHRVVRAVAPHCSGFDVVEVNDRDDGQAAVLGAKLLRAFVFAREDATGALEAGTASEHEGGVTDRAVVVDDKDELSGGDGEPGDTAEPDGSVSDEPAAGGTASAEENEPPRSEGDPGDALEEADGIIDGDAGVPLEEADVVDSEEFDDTIEDDLLPEDDPLAGDDPVAEEPWPDWSPPDDEGEEDGEDWIVAESEPIQDEPREENAPGSASEEPEDSGPDGSPADPTGETGTSPAESDSASGEPESTPETAESTPEEPEHTSEADEPAPSPRREEPSQPEDEAGSPGAGSDEPGPGKGAGREDVTVTKGEYKRVTRMLQNREFPVDREEFEVVAANAYDLRRAKCAKVLDVAIEQGLLDEESGQLYPPDD